MRFSSFNLSGRIFGIVAVWASSVVGGLDVTAPEGRDGGNNGLSTASTTQSQPQIVTDGAPCCTIYPLQEVGINVWYTSSIEVTVATEITTYLQYAATEVFGSISTIRDGTATSLYGFHSQGEQLKVSGIPSDILPASVTNVPGAGTRIAPLTSTALSDMTIYSPLPFLSIPSVTVMTGTIRAGSCLQESQSGDPAAPLSALNVSLNGPFGDVPDVEGEDWFNNGMLDNSGSSDAFELDLDIASLLELTSNASSRIPSIGRCDYATKGQGAPTVIIPAQEVTMTSATTLLVNGNYSFTRSPTPIGNPASTGISLVNNTEVYYNRTKQLRPTKEKTDDSGVLETGDAGRGYAVAPPSDDQPSPPPPQPSSLPGQDIGRVIASIVGIPEPTAQPIYVHIGLGGDGPTAPAGEPGVLPESGQLGGNYQQPGTGPNPGSPGTGSGGVLQGGNSPGSGGYDGGSGSPAAPPSSSNGYNNGRPGDPGGDSANPIPGQGATSPTIYVPPTAATNYVVSGTTLTPGATTVINGQTFYLDQSGGQIHAGQRTYDLPTNPAVPPSPITLDRLVITPVPTSVYVAARQTIPPGAAVTIDGTLYVAGPRPTALAGMTDGADAVYITINGRRVLVSLLSSPNGAVLLGATTLTAGAVITQGGTTLSVAPGGTAVVVGINGVSSTVLLPVGTGAARGPVASTTSVGAIVGGAPAGGVSTSVSGTGGPVPTADLIDDGSPFSGGGSTFVFEGICGVGLLNLVMALMACIAVVF